MGVAIEQLKKEHVSIETMLRILEAVCGKLTAGQKADPEHLSQILDFFHTFADKCHHGKEEEIFFPSLEMAGIPREGGPIGVMLQEHDRLRGFMAGFSGAVGRYRAGESDAGTEIVRHAADYTTMLRQHIEKENEVLFKMAETQLSPEEEKEIMERFDRMESEKLGEGTHEKLHTLLEHLEGIYL